MRKKSTPLWLMAGCAVLATGKILGVDKLVCKVSSKVKAYFKKAKDEVEDTVEDVKEEIKDASDSKD